MGNVTEICAMEKRPKQPPVQKIDKDTFINWKTGALGNYKHIENRSQCADSMRHTMRTIRNLINTNCTEPENIRWCTFTYAENMTDTKQLYEDWKYFRKKFDRWLTAQKIAIPEYINVIEPQGRGAWHIHCFFIWNEKAPFIDNNSVLEMLWAHGFTSIKSVGDVDNIGAYFSAYLADMPIEEFKAMPAEQKEEISALCEIKTVEGTAEDEAGNKVEKKYVKGARLFLYPSGMNIVRRSRGIKDPVIEEMTYFKAKEKVSSAKETFSSTYVLLDESGHQTNSICKSYYNSKRHDKSNQK